MAHNGLKQHRQQHAKIKIIRVVGCFAMCLRSDDDAVCMLSCSYQGSGGFGPELYTVQLCAGPFGGYKGISGGDLVIPAKVAPRHA